MAKSVNANATQVAISKVTGVCLRMWEFSQTSEATGNTVEKVGIYIELDDDTIVKRYSLKSRVDSKVRVGKVIVAVESPSKCGKYLNVESVFVKPQ